MVHLGAVVDFAVISGVRHRPLTAGFLPVNGFLPVFRRIPAGHRHRMEIPVLFDSRIFAGAGAGAGALPENKVLI